eukprot:SAG31_NODE_750_length_12362_cov_6.912827_6_plen_60_part_00
MLMASVQILEEMVYMRKREEAMRNTNGAYSPRLHQALPDSWIVLPWPFFLSHFLVVAAV